MPRAWYHASHATATTILAVVTLSAAVAVAQPGSPPGGAPPSASGAPAAEACDPGVAAWAKNASVHAGLTISAVACPTGVVRLQVAGAGCDFEVAPARGFQRTADGKFGVSPIADLNWDVAPEPMKKALAGVLAALAQDPSLPIREGDPVRHAGPEAMPLGSRRNQIIAGSAGGALVVAAAVGFWLKRRRDKAASPVASTAPLEPIATPEAAAAPGPIEPPAPPAA
jgi:hypothetical protein